MARKKSKIQNKPLIIFFLLIFAGLILITTSLAINTNRASKLSFAGSYTNSSTKKDKIIPIKVAIPKIDASFDIYKTRIVDGNWEISEKGVSYLENSSGIGEKHSAVLYNHNTKGNFDNLHKLKVNDTIVLEGSDKKLHVYKVKSIRIVDPSEVKVLTEDSSENIILYTCYGFADLKRLVVKAVPTD